MNDLKVLFASDFHLRSKFAHHIPDPEFLSRGLRHIKESLDWLVRQAKEHQPDMFVFGGDLIDNPRQIDFTGYGLAYDFFAEMKEVCETFAIVGNHDIQGGCEWAHALYPLDIEVIDSPLDLVREGLPPIRFIPYIKGMDGPTLQHVRQRRVPITFTHVGFVDLLLPHGSSFGPFKYEDFNSDYVISGHYHIPTSFAGGAMMYSGALLPCGFRDAGPHAFGALLTHVEKEGTEVRTTFLENPHAPAYLKVSDNELQTEWNLADRPVYFHIKTSDPTTVRERAQIAGIDPSLILKATPVDIDLVSEGVTEQVSSSISMDEAIDTYVKAHSGLSTEQMEELAKVGKDLFKAVSPAEASTAPIPYSLESIEMAGFMSVGYVNLPISEGLTFIEGLNLDDGGSNGAGKSTIVEAVFWALYGKTLRETSKAGDVVNTDMGFCAVAVTLAHPDGSKLVVFRYRGVKELGSSVKFYTSSLKGRKGRGDYRGDGKRGVEPWRGVINYSHISKYINNLETLDACARARPFDDSIEYYNLTRSSVAATTALILEHVGISQKLFRLTTLFSKRSTLISHESDGDRAGEFLGFLDFGTEEALVHAKEVRTGVMTQIQQLEYEKQTFGVQKANDLAHLRRGVAALEDRSTQDVQSSLLQQLKTQRADLEKLQEWLATNPEPDVKAQELLIAEANAKVNGFRDKVNRRYAIYDDARNKLHKFDAAFASGVTGACPVCEKPMSEVEAVDHRATLASECQALKSDWERFDAKANKATNQLNISALTTELRQRQRTLDQRYSTSRRCTGLDCQIVATRGSLEQLKAKDEDLSGEIAKLHAEIETRDASSFDGGQKLNSLERHRDMLKFWIQGFSRRGLPTHLLSRVVEWANTRLGTYLALVSDGATRAWFQCADKGISLACSRPDGQRSYRTLSDGQQACVDLSVQLAFHDVQRLTLGGLGFMFFDEAISHLDSVRAQQSIVMLQEKLGSCKTIFVITHRSDVYDDTAMKLRATLSNKTTTYEWVM